MVPPETPPRAYKDRPSPSPSPLGRGRGEGEFRRHDGSWIGAWLVAFSPSPLGRGRGEGELPFRRSTRHIMIPSRSGSRLKWSSPSPSPFGEVGVRGKYRSDHPLAMLLYPRDGVA